MGITDYELKKVLPTKAQLACAARPPYHGTKCGGSAGRLALPWYEIYEVTLYDLHVLHGLRMVNCMIGRVLV